MSGAVSVGLFTTTADSWTTSATTPSPYAMSVGSGTNAGDLHVDINGASVSLDNGVAMTSSAQGGIGNDNYVTAYQGGGDVMVISTADNTAGGGAVTEQSSNAAVAFFPFADGWSSGNMTGSTVNSGNTTGVSIFNPSTGTYRIDGLSTTGNLMAFSQGNHTSSGGDNTLGVSHDGSSWIVESYDNSGSLENGSDWSWIYVPDNATGIISGIIDMDTGAVTALSGDAELLGLSGSDTGVGEALLTIGDGTIVNPSTAALFMVGNENNELGTVSGDNIYSYEANGNAFEINAEDNPNQGTENGSVRFVIIAYDTITAGTAVPEPSSYAILAGLAAFFTVVCQRRFR